MFIVDKSYQNKIAIDYPNINTKALSDSYSNKTVRLRIISINVGLQTEKLNIFIK